MKNEKIKIGSHVFIRLVGNAARSVDPDKLIQEWEITKVGRKYIYAKPLGRDNAWNEVCFEFVEKYWNYNPGCWVEKSDYSPNYILYLSKQEVFNEVKKQELCQKLSKFATTSVSALNIDELQQVCDIFETAMKRINSNS